MNEFVRSDANGCPDAEMLAAWSDGGLRRDERVHVEAHVAGCARCQSHLLAMARMPSADAVPARGGRRLRLWPWLVPATSAAAAVGVWFLVQPAVTPEPPERPAQLAIQSEDKTAAAAVPERSRSVPPAAATNAARSELRDLKRESRSRRLAQPTAPPPAPAAEAPAPSEKSVEQRQESLAAGLAADASAITGLKVRRGADGQVTWDRESPGLEGQIVAASSPSPSVVWLAGRAGLVLLSLDGQTWEQRSIPAATDLTAVQASSAASAVVTTTDGRRFATTDGGVTWALQ